MVNLYKVYPRVNDTISVTDLAELEMPLTISAIEVLGESKKTVKLGFEDTELKHKCSKADVFLLAKEFETNELDDFEGKELTLKDVDGKVKLEV